MLDLSEVLAMSIRLTRYQISDAHALSGFFLHGHHISHKEDCGMSPCRHFCLLISPYLAAQFRRFRTKLDARVAVKAMAGKLARLPMPRAKDALFVGYRHHLVSLSVVGTGLSLAMDVEPYGPDDSP